MSVKNTRNYRRFYYAEKFDRDRFYSGSQRLHGWLGGGHHRRLQRHAGKAEGSKSLYSQEDALATTAKEIINRYALVGWTSGGHSNGYVPAFAIGVGAEQFSGRIDNTEVPKRTRKAFTLTQEERNARVK